MSKSIQGSKNMVYSQNPEREEIRSGGDWAKKGDFKQERHGQISLWMETWWYSFSHQIFTLSLYQTLYQ